MRILHIPTGEYCLIAPFRSKSTTDYLIDKINNNNDWNSIQSNISVFKWLHLCYHNKINHIYVYNKDRYMHPGGENLKRFV